VACAISRISRPPAPRIRLRRREAELSRHNRSPAASLSADVWGEVALTADRLAVPSRTRANADAFRARRPSLVQREEAFRAGFLSRDMGTVKTSLKF
jgi:hypothetical protein